MNRLTNVSDWATRKTSFEYDLASRLKKITRPNGTVRELFYDVAGQTTNIIERAGNQPIAFFKMNWNTAARMEWEFVAPSPHSYTPPGRTNTYDDDNRLATFNGNNVAHDSDGNMTSGPLTNSTFASYTFDARNRLLNAGGLDYGYDPANNRTSLTNGTNVTRFVINPNAALSQTLIRVKNGVTNYYVYGLGLLYEADDSGNTKTYHFDYRGSTVALTDGSGTVTDRIEYSTYGTTSYRAGTTDTPFLYNGRYGVQTDANGLLYMRARYYNPFLCRFLNADPSGFSGGLNFYAYADGNPISLIDPFGLDAAGAVDTWSWIWAGTTATLNQLANSLIPGQNSWNNAVASYQNGNYGSAAFSAGLMLGEQVLFALTFGQSGVGASAIQSTESELVGSIRNVNPTGGGMNCVNCAIAGDATLAGNAASALPGAKTAISTLESTFGSSFQPVSGQMQIGSILSQSGNGARGIVFGESLTVGQPGHVFNVINQGGTILFLDAQAGGLGVNNLNNLQNFQFLLTHP